MKNIVISGGTDKALALTYLIRRDNIVIIGTQGGKLNDLLGVAFADKYGAGRPDTFMFHPSTSPSTRTPRSGSMTSPGNCCHIDIKLYVRGG
ncbi:hypothetical protein GCM10010911_18510 [Paenibacillus nasutitermitis]|uniref:Uncharacterized protein n=1 Tax=Paenibacillus nasutitermitis TaxID=1652958 RepID=A0A916YV25_9BACL|nr:hypothetical protein GCM10010911_18510 [Paenibacillus nasutitermitis]